MTDTERPQPSNPFTPFPEAALAQSIPARFEAMVEQNPEQVAIQTTRAIATYDELNQLANRMAHATLARRGTALEPIALLLPKDIRLIAGLLGTLKAGKFFLLLDPAALHTRLQALIAQAQPGLIMTDNTGFAACKSSLLPNCDIVNLDTEPLPDNATNLTLSLAPERPACLLYTSGSTGHPKGVVHTHYNELHHTMIYTNTLHIRAEDRLTLLHACSFAAALRNLLSALLNGATILPFDVQTEGLTTLVNWLQQQGVTIYHSGPTLFRTLVQALSPRSSFPDLRLLLFSGEPLTEQDVAHFRTHFPPTCLCANLWGATEVGVVLAYFLDHTTELASPVVPVGFAMGDTAVMLESHENGELTPGQEGAVIIRSPSLSIGYWQQPELSRAVFQSAPDDPRYGHYRTGDAGRMLPDGSLLYLGRQDAQLKIRGYQVDPATIEAALRTLDTVQDAIVIDFEDDAGTARLVAYIVPSEGACPHTRAIQQHLGETLPPYMIPAVIIALDALPQTSSGKVDRRTLPPPMLDRTMLDGAFVPPRTPIEEMLTEMWTDILGWPHIGIHDNFLALGGDSLRATQLTARVQARMQVDIPLPALLNAPTIAEMALVVMHYRLQSTSDDELEQLLAELEEE